MDNKIILTVSILTYNQPEELKRTLDTILPQMKKGVEIVINDNSDDSGAEKLIKRDFQNRYIRYFKNEGERTFDANVLRAVERARGEYVWLFGDEGIAPDAINSILKIIRKTKYNFIFTNFYEINQGPGKPAVILSSDEIVNDGNIVLEKVANVLGFVSSIILRKDCLSIINKQEMNKFFGLAFIHFYLALHALSSPGKFYLCSRPYVCIYPPSPDRPAYADGFNVFAVHFFNIANSFKNKFKKESLKKMLAKNFGHIWRGILVASIRGHNTSIKQLMHLPKCYWNFAEFWLALPFFLMPSFINVFFYKVYKKLKTGNKNQNSVLTRVPWF